MDNQYSQNTDPRKPDSRKPQSTEDETNNADNVSQAANPGSIQKTFSPGRFLIITIGGIFLAEVAAMIVVRGFPSIPYYLQVLIDATIMVVLIFPLVYYVSLKPLLLYIEKHQRLENALRQSEERFALAYRSNPAALSITRVEDNRFIEVNDSFLRQSGYARTEVIGRTPDELNLYPIPEEQEKLNWLLLRQRSVDDFEMTIRVKSGEFRNVSVSTEAIELDGKVNILAVASDITERKQAAELVERERRRFYDVLETLPVFLVLLTPEYRASFANRSYREKFGEFRGHRCYEYLFGRNEPCEVCENHKVLNSMMPGRWEWVGPDGHIYEVSSFPFTDVDGSTLILEMGVDITEKKHAEARLRRVNHALTILKRCNQVLVRAGNEIELLQQMCEVIVDIGQYRMAWVGFAEQDADRNVRPVAQFGFDDGYLGLTKITWADDEYGQSPTSTAIREGVTQVNQNFQTNPKMEVWRASALLRGYQSNIALPLRDGKSILGALTIYSTSPDAFDEEEVNLLNELADDLAFGITMLRVRLKHDQAQEQMREMALFPALSPDAVLRVDASGQIEKTNPTADQMGLCVGAHLTDILPDLIDLDLPACIAAGVTQQVQLEARLGEHVFLWTVRGVPDLGLAFLYGKDISHRKHAEVAIRQLSRIVEQTEDTVVVTDRMGVIEYVNPAFERLTGYTKDEALGKTPNILKSGIHDGQFYKVLWKTILDGEVFLSEIANRKKNGELFYEVKTITPLRDEQAGITHFVATGKDITKHKLDEDKLRKAYEELELRVQERTKELKLANSELEQEITERKRAEEGLRTANEELMRFNNAMVGRELRMIELKKEVNMLCEIAGQPSRYPLNFEKEM